MKHICRFLTISILISYAIAEAVTCEIVSETEVECNGVSFSSLKSSAEEEHYTPDEFMFWVFVAIALFFVCFGGLMSGLTVGLMSLDPMNVEIIRKVGTPQEKKYAARILPLLEKHHRLLVTLLLSNAVAMEALPIFLDRISSPVVAIAISVTAVLFFGEIIPQALVLRFGLAIGANLAWLCHVLMFVLTPIGWPIAKLLDYLLGHPHKVFQRMELKELVDLHGQQHSGPLTVDELTVIKGALDLKNKNVQACMTPIEKVYMLDGDRVLDEKCMSEIKVAGHSRIPIYKEKRGNIVGMLLVKSLLFTPVQDKIMLKDLDLREIPSLEAASEAYEVLNLFQTGHSHMAGIKDDKGEIIGVVTLEDIIEELIQEEIYDEADLAEHYAAKARQAIAHAQRLQRGMGISPTTPGTVPRHLSVSPGGDPNEGLEEHHRPRLPKSNVRSSIDDRDRARPVVTLDDIRIDS